MQGNGRAALVLFPMLEGTVLVIGEVFAERDFLTLFKLRVAEALDVLRPWRLRLLEFLVIEPMLHWDARRLRLLIFGDVADGLYSSSESDSSRGIGWTDSPLMESPNPESS